MNNEETKLDFSKYDEIMKYIKPYVYINEVDNEYTFKNDIAHDIVVEFIIKMLPKFDPSRGTLKNLSIKFAKVYLLDRKKSTIRRFNREENYNMNFIENNNRTESIFDTIYELNEISNFLDEDDISILNRIQNGFSVNFKSERVKNTMKKIKTLLEKDDETN